MSNMVDSPAVADLRERARKRGIDGYGSMTEDELREALFPLAVVDSAEDAVNEVTEATGYEPQPGLETPADEDLYAATVVELRQQARDLGIEGARAMNKAELVQAIRAATAVVDEDLDIDVDDDEDGDLDDGDIVNTNR